MKVKIKYYYPIEREIEMTPEEYCGYHSNGIFHNEKVVPNNAIFEETILDEAAEEELNNYFWENQKKT